MVAVFIVTLRYKQSFRDRWWADTHVGTQKRLNRLRFALAVSVTKAEASGDTFSG